MCSFAAQGLWMRMLSIAAREQGYVRVSGKSCTVEDIARIVGHPLDEVRKLIEELATNRVFSRTNHGTIYNRRMIADQKRSESSRQWGLKGGNPALLATSRNNTGKPHTLNPPLNQGLNGGGSTPSSLYPIPKKEARDARAKHASLNGSERGANRNGADLPTNDPWPQRIAAFGKSGFWQPFWGPKPGEPGCFAPNGP